MTNHCLIWYPLLLVETAIFIQTACAGYKFQKQFALLSLLFLPLCAADPKKPAGHGGGKPDIAQAVSQYPEKRRGSITFEPHLRRMEDEIVKQLKVKVTMRQKRTMGDMGLKVEVLLRDTTVACYYLDLIQEQSDSE